MSASTDGGSGMDGRVSAEVRQPVVEPGSRSVCFRGDRGIPVYAHDFGGRGEPLLIAHAAGFCGGAYAPLAAELSDRHEVWAIDLRGHGDSPAPTDRNFSWDGMARDVLNVAAGLGRGPMAFIGHSLGGGAGLRAESLMPGTFSSMYVYEPAVLPGIAGVDAMGSAMGAMVRQRRATFGSRAEAVARLSTRPPFDTMCPDALIAFALHGLRAGDDGRLTLKCSPEDEAAVYEAPNKITIEQIGQVSVPVLLGMGEREQGLPALAAPMIVSSLVDASLVTYPGLGHLGPFESPSLVAADAAAHFARQPTRVIRTER
jgi:pimeloyl-ACP methyl ester carboxylesterase